MASECRDPDRDRAWPVEYGAPPGAWLDLFMADGGWLRAVFVLMLPRVYDNKNMLADYV